MGRDRYQKWKPEAVPPAAPSVAGFELIKTGEYGEVWCSLADAEAFKQLGKEPDRRRMQEFVRLNRHLQRFADRGTAGFDSSAFKPQGKQKSGHNSLQVYAFKADQYRLYGVLDKRVDRVCFVGLATDPSKKDDKADADLLKKVASRVSEWGNGGSKG